MFVVSMSIIILSVVSMSIIILSVVNMSIIILNVVSMSIITLSVVSMSIIILSVIASYGNTHSYIIQQYLTCVVIDVNPLFCGKCLNIS